MSFAQLNIRFTVDETTVSVVAVESDQ